MLGSPRSSCSAAAALPGIGRTINGATLWVDIGPIVFQPGELAKVLIVIFLAGYLRDNREMLSYGAGGGHLPSPKHLGPLLLIWGGAMLVLFQTRDLGGALLYFAIFLVMLYTATARWSFVAVGMGLFLAGAVALYQVIPHVQTRVQGWLDPWSDPQGDTYQLVQSIYAISSGGVFGSGLGNGVLLTPEQPIHPLSRPTSSSPPRCQELGLAALRRHRLYGFSPPRLRVAMRPRRVLEALGGRATSAVASRLHHHRRRRRAHPLTGYTAIRSLRRVGIVSLIVLALLLMGRTREPSELGEPQIRAVLRLASVRARSRPRVMAVAAPDYEARQGNPALVVRELEVRRVIYRPRATASRGTPAETETAALDFRRYHAADSPQRGRLLDDLALSPGLESR